MFLSGAILAEQGNEWFRPFSAKQIVGAAYEMRMGDEAYVSLEIRGDRKPALLQLQHEQQFDIPAGQFAFLLTREHITVPYDMIAFINMRNSLKSRGLVNVSGFHVDPGYRGRLVFSVYNAGPNKITLRESDRAFLIWFSRLEGATQEYSRNKPGYSKIESDLIAQIPEESASYNSLKNQVDEINNTLSWRRTLKIYVAGILSAALAGFLGGVLLELLKGPPNG